MDAQKNIETDRQTDKEAENHCYIGWYRITEYRI